MKNWIRTQVIPQEEQPPVHLQLMALVAVMLVALAVFVTMRH
ncbi:MAG: hypothetical protein V4697_00425 [Patescibacteria group bacterium]